ncbi:hypothetical protein J2W14_000409 [Pseudarthrobacter oxydans]|uniref:hypothetical protein n=1 Tax=Pseudarthrobacter oxydans TaxID=1671 RepID=UPI002780AFD1|nr:hypothetical protein [Pseudarthrobacter oxydans]
MVIDMGASRLWDASTIASLDAITEKYRHHGKSVDVGGLNDASLLMRQRLDAPTPRCANASAASSAPATRPRSRPVTSVRTRKATACRPDSQGFQAAAEE